MSSHAPETPYPSLRAVEAGLLTASSLFGRKKGKISIFASTASVKIPRDARTLAVSLEGAHVKKESKEGLRREKEDRRSG